MAAPDLDRILSQLRRESLDQLPITETADRIEMLAAADLEKLKKSEDAGKLASMVSDWHIACKNARAADEQDWYKSLDMYQGRHFTLWDKNRGSMVEPPAPDYEPRIAINITESICRTELAKTGSGHPTATVSPASRDDEDLMAALAGQQVWDWFYYDSAFQTNIFNPANFWRTVTGNGFIKVYQDHGAIDPAATEAARRAYEKTQQQETQQGLTEMAPPAPAPGPVMGRIKADPVSPFHLFVPDLSEMNLQKQAYVLHVYTMPVERAKLAYAEYTPKGWEPTTVSADSVMNVAHLGIKGGNPANKDAVLVIEAWVKPGYTSALPKGGLIVTVADEIVAMSNEGMPYEHGEYPFAHLPGIESGKFYRKSVVQSILPLQNELNRTYAQIIKAKNLMSKPQFFYQEGSVDPRRITSKAGQYIPIRLGMANPAPVPITELPQYVVGLIDNIKQHLDDISGQHQVSRAISPGADTAASALAFLAETDDSFLSSVHDGINAAATMVARHQLALAVQFWDEPRLIKITGQSEAFDAKVLSGSDLANGTDIRIDPESMLPKSKAGRVATITDWIDKGIIAPEVGLEAMEMGTLGKIYDRLKVDRDSARRENFAIRDLDPAAIAAHYQEQMAAQASMAAPAEGFAGLQDPAIGLEQPVEAAPVDSMAPPVAPPPLNLFFPINWYDNDQIHIEEHEMFAKGQAYQLLSPEAQSELEQHTLAHRERLAQKAQAAATWESMGADPGAGAAAPATDGYAGANEPQSIAA